MARVAVPRQLGVPGVARADSPYSRVLAMELLVPAGVGNSDFCFTPPLGNRLVLRGIDLWMHCQIAGAFLGGFVYLMYGQGVPPTGSVIATRWNFLIEQHCGIKPGQRFTYCEHVELHYSMNRLFEFDEIRFGVSIENLFNQQWTALVLFEISEG